MVYSRLVAGAGLVVVGGLGWIGEITSGGVLREPVQNVRSIITPSWICLKLSF